ncbi:hypothetical protein YQE_04722, partial [Dendroctonus ponderosae]
MKLFVLAVIAALAAGANAQGYKCPPKDGQYEDSRQCDKYYECVDGEAVAKLCPDGLVFDPLIRKRNKCDQPFNVDCGDRTELHILKDGFQCPKDSQKDANGVLVVHPKFAHPTDCQRFYVCLNGIEPRDLGCQVGEVYNEESQRCDAPENVAGCEDWYKDDPAASSKPSKKA